MDISKFKNFSKVKVLIVGDVMIDRFWWGNVTRISPEAPVPVVKLEKTSLVAGGAANVAVNVAELGAQALLVGIVGDDEEAKLLPELLGASKVSDEFLVKIPNRQTTVKTRIIAHSQQIVRLDQESKYQLKLKDEQKVWKNIEGLLEKADIIIISDYAKGLLTNNLLKRLITTARGIKKIVLVDPKGKDFTKYKNAAILTPNRSEVLEAYKLESVEKESAEQLSEKIISDLNLDALLITQGEDGMSLFEKNKKPQYLMASARDVYDVTGAGDTVIACLAVAIGSGMSFLNSAKFANLAAGLVVEHIGTTPISLEMLKNS
jgi:D-beta-D-heptose 7-phosphate kinase/D-beta-D-heptose 1-phosphate adenosyltransferase